MPIYSYKCKKCGKIFDKFQKMSGNGKVNCESCGGEAFRLFSPVGIIFKGSGFYTTDYGSGTNKSSVDSKTDSKDKVSGEKDKSAKSNSSDTKDSSSSKGKEKLKD